MFNVPKEAAQAIQRAKALLGEHTEGYVLAMALKGETDQGDPTEGMLVVYGGHCMIAEGLVKRLQDSPAHALLRLPPPVGFESDEEEE